MEALLTLGVLVAVILSGGLSAVLTRMFLIDELTYPSGLGLEPPQQLRGQTYYVLSERQYRQLYGAYLRELEKACGRRV